MTYRATAIPHSAWSLPAAAGIPHWLTRNGTRAACALTVLFGICASSHASIIWDNIDINGGVSSTAQSLVSQLDNGFGFDAGAADDFFLSPSGHASGDWLVNGVNWAGKFTGSSPVPIPGFNIIVWPNAPGDRPAGGTPGGPPDYTAALAVYANVAATSTPIDGLEGSFDYTALLPTPFLAHANSRYWIEVQAAINYPPLWEFHATVFRRLLLPYTGYDLVGIPFWSVSPGNSDLAFQLVGDSFPEPASLFGFVVAAVVCTKRRIR